MTEQKPVQDLTFEEAMAELETVVRQLETGRIKLDEAVATYERGVQLKNFCAEKLQNAKAKIDLLVLDTNNTPTGVTSFDDKIEK